MQKGKRKTEGKVLGELIDYGNGNVELVQKKGSGLSYGVDKAVVRFKEYPKFVKKPICKNFNDWVREEFDSKAEVELLDKLSEVVSPKTCKLPIHPDMSYKSMAESLCDNNVRRFKESFISLVDKEAICCFNDYNRYSDYKMHWMLNPALYFNGSYIRLDVLTMFMDTEPMMKLREYSDNKI